LLSQAAPRTSDSGSINKVFLSVMFDCSPKVHLLHNWCDTNVFYAYIDVRKVVIMTLENLPMSEVAIEVEREAMVGISMFF
jgi:hypothetical protein